MAKKKLKHTAKLSTPALAPTERVLTLRRWIKLLEAQLRQARAELRRLLE